MPNSAPIATGSIEISSLRLHCGRAANYGSTIIIPDASSRYVGATCISVLLSLFTTQMDSRSSSGDVPRFAIQLSRYRRMSSYNKSDSSFGNFVVKQKLFKKFGRISVRNPTRKIKFWISLSVKQLVAECTVYNLHQTARPQCCFCQSRAYINQ